MAKNEAIPNFFIDVALTTTEQAARYGCRSVDSEVLPVVPTFVSLNFLQPQRECRGCDRLIIPQAFIPGDDVKATCFHRKFDHSWGDLGGIHLQSAKRWGDKPVTGWRVGVKPKGELVEAGAIGSGKWAAKVVEVGRVFAYCTANNESKWHLLTTGKIIQQPDGTLQPVCPESPQEAVYYFQSARGGIMKFSHIDWRIHV
jgi:hypothetical protein